MPMTQAASPAARPVLQPAAAAPAAADPIPRELTDEMRLEFAEASRKLESAEPPEIVRWAAERFGSRLTMATAFGPEGCLIIHWLATIAPSTYVFNLDTGYQFQETLDLRDAIAKRYGIDVVLEQPETTVADYEAIHGGPIYRTDPDRCCRERKIAVVTRVLSRFGAWMSGIRRDQSPDRATAAIVGWDHKFGVAKISPLANWTKAKVWDAIVREKVPYNPLHDKGYVSIGCQPCTRAITLGEDERAGRWSGSAKTECGLHSKG